jgi:hypothetical protein
MVEVRNNRKMDIPRAGENVTSIRLDEGLQQDAEQMVWQAIRKKAKADNTFTIRITVLLKIIFLSMIRLYIIFFDGVSESLCLRTGL